MNVSVIKSENDKGLIPSYDYESDVLELTHQIQKDWVYGCDINGTIIFDIDKNLILRNVELLIPQKLWEKNKHLDFPSFNVQSDLKFSVNEVKNQSFYSKNLKVYFDGNNVVLVKMFPFVTTNIQYVSLSKFCFGIINRGKLVGFYVKFP